MVNKRSQIVKRRRMKRQTGVPIVSDALSMGGSLVESGFDTVTGNAKDAGMFVADKYLSAGEEVIDAGGFVVDEATDVGDFVIDTTSDVGGSVIDATGIDGGNQQPQGLGDIIRKFRTPLLIGGGIAVAGAALWAWNKYGGKAKLPQLG